MLASAGQSFLVGIILFNIFFSEIVPDVLTLDLHKMMNWLNAVFPNGFLRDMSEMGVKISFFDPPTLTRLVLIHCRPPVRPLLAFPGN